MRFDDFEARMRQREVYHSLRVPDSAWIVIRVDGRGFSRFTQSRFAKPFDLRFHEAMLEAAQRLLSDFAGLYAYSESDEISVLLAQDSQMFDRELEKLVSLSAACASAVLSLALQTELHCDSRLWVGETPEQVLEYFRWRQSDAARCGLNGWCYWTLRQAGCSAAQAHGRLKGLGFGDKQQLLLQHGVSLDSIPLWQLRGSGLYWEEHQKSATNPLTGQEVMALRRRLNRNLQLPTGSAYADLIGGLLRAKA